MLSRSNPVVAENYVVDLDRGRSRSKGGFQATLTKETGLYDFLNQS